MTGETIKSFLVGLNFDIDDAGLSKFNKSIAAASVKVLALGASIEAVATAVGYGISNISKDFEQMGYEYRIIAPAINKALVLRRELLKAYAAAGLNITKVIQNSVKLNLSLAKTGFAFKAIYDSVGSRFFGLITKQSDMFRENLLKNMPKIQKTLESVVKFLFKAFEATTTLGSRLFEILLNVFDFFVKLDKATSGWSTIIFGVIAAWKLLNLSFLATPLGILLSLAAAVLALYDDFKTFQEGGNSFFNWSAAIPSIKALEEVISTLSSVLNNLFQVLFAVGDSIYHLISGDFAGFWTRIGLAVESVIDAFKRLWDTIKAGAGLGGAVGSWIANAFGNNPQAASKNAAPALGPSPSPLGAGPQNNQTNQHVNQQTNISVMGSADANAVGHAVAGQQNRVNFDMIQNMKPNAR